MKRYEVFYMGRLITVVIYDAAVTLDAIKRDLIVLDGLPWGVEVRGGTLWTPS